MSSLADLDDATLFGRLPDEGAREALLVRHRPLALCLARKRGCPEEPVVVRRAA